ncbi:glycosyltransferase [bacterium]|nr:glycosyltransferase [bacterium]RQV95310.1 MAG: glycosyltransferase [bacterium]
MKGTLDEVYRYLSDQDYSSEVILVDDESTDNSRMLMKDFIDDKPNFQLYDIPHGGKPAAIWTGIQKAKGKIVLFTDMDQSTPISELDQLLPWYKKGFDVVIGSRGADRKGLSIIRRIGSMIFRNLRSLFLLRNIYDTQCGFKSCWREAAKDIFPHLQFLRQRRKPTGWKVSAYDVELLYLFEKAGYRIKEVIVEWQDRDRSDTKNQKGKGDLFRYINESVEMAKEVLQVKLNQLKGSYKKIKIQKKT